MTSSRTPFSSFAFFSFSSFLPVSRRPRSSFSPSGFFPVILPISSRICAMRALIPSSGARRRSTLSGRWKDNPAMCSRQR